MNFLYDWPFVLIQKRNDYSFFLLPECYKHSLFITSSKVSGLFYKNASENRLVNLSKIKRLLIECSCFKIRRNKKADISLPRLFDLFFSCTFFKNSLILFFCFIPWICPAQTNVFNSPADKMIGRTGATGSHAWSFFSNSAGTASLSNPVVGVGYESAYHLKELSSRAAFLLWPTNYGMVGGGFAQYGFSHYNLQQYSLSFSKELSPWLNLGVRYNYIMRHQTGDRTRWLPLFDGGLQIFPVERFSIGFYAVNPAQTQWRFTEMEEYHPTFVAASVMYAPSSELFIELGLVKEMETPAVVAFNVEVPVHQMLVLRGGASSSPLRLAFGSGVNWEMLTFDVGFNHHANLGFSSAFGILYHLGKNRGGSRP